MTPSEDYLNFLNNIDIRGVTTAAGRVIVGEYYDSTEDGILLLNPFVFNEPFGIEPLYPFSIDIPSLIYSDKIETEIFAGIALKKQYYQQYLALKVNVLDSSESEY